MQPECSVKSDGIKVLDTIWYLYGEVVWILTLGLNPRAIYIAVNLEWFSNVATTYHFKYGNGRQQARALFIMYLDFDCPEVHSGDPSEVVLTV